MGSGSSHKTDLYSLFDYVQNTIISEPKDIFIEVLRNYFEQDSYYHYSRDAWGFPNVVDQTDLPQDAGYDDEVSTRLLIGEYLGFRANYYPAILVKYGSGKSRPMSMSRNKNVVQWEAIHYVDGYGNETYINTPSYFVQSGAWEGSIIVDVETKSMKSRDELVSLISVGFVDAFFEDLVNSGVVIKSGSPSIGSPNEEDDRNDKIFKQSITFDIYSEWRRHLAIDNVVNAINICVELGDVSEEPFVPAPNLSIVTSIDLIEALSS